jgi:hypothetical protein
VTPEQVVGWTSAALAVVALVAALVLLALALERAAEAVDRWRARARRREQLARGVPGYWARRSS